MLPTKTLMQQWINDYLRDNPEGLDVMAYVLDKIGQDDFGVYCGARAMSDKAKQKRMDQAKQNFGKEISDKLEGMFHIVDHLAKVDVDAARWPSLVKWVNSFQQHRVDTKRRKLW